MISTLRDLVRSGVVLAAVAALVAGCATRPDPVADPDGYADYVEANDPIEPFNRAMWEFNLAADAMIGTPLAIMYRDVFVPPILQKGLGNFLDNLRLPVTFVHDVLQWNLDRAQTSAVRFLINTTAGVGGFFDFATDLGYPYHREDMGQTLAVWGVPEGPFLMLPILGPSNPRDAIGVAFDSYGIDPIGLLGAIGSSIDGLTTFSAARAVTEGARSRADLLDPMDELQKTSLDFYAAVRSAYRQNREKLIRDGAQKQP